MTDLQQVEFKLLQAVDIVCKQLNIKYYLICGSALGAVKYSGFIPWDDDLDIGCSRTAISCRIIAPTRHSHRYSARFAIRILLILRKVLRSYLSIMAFILMYFLWMDIQKHRLRYADWSCWRRSINWWQRAHSSCHAVGVPSYSLDWSAC